MNPLISIIVPVYNGEQYIERIINTALDQTGKNFEMICVNDGSTDRTAELLLEYTSRYSWLQVINQKNKGLTGARNAGIEAASGEYIMFLDADDYLEDNTCELVTDRIKKYSPDILDFGMYYVTEDGNKNPGHHKLPKETLMDRSMIDEKIIPPLINLKSDPDAFIYDYIWNKVFRRNIIIEHGIRFLESRRIWEDRPFLVNYLIYANNYYSIESYLYNYVSVENSLSRRYDLQFFDIILENYSLYHAWFSNRYDFTVPHVYQYWSHSIENMIIRSLEQTEKKEEIRANIEKIVKHKTVLEWFEKREIINDHDKKVNQYILNGDTEGLLVLYTKTIKARSRKRGMDLIKQKLYSVLRK